MPVTPHACAVAFDRRACELARDFTSSQDEEWLNQAQVRRCIYCVFASRQLTAEEEKGVRTLLARRTGPSGSVDADMSWNLDILQLPEPSTLSFLRRLN